MPKVGQQRGTPQRRAEFIARLREMGDGPECVYWPWSDTRDDYVAIHVDGRIERAHRWVYSQVHGVELDRRGQFDGPGEQVIMHTCDNKACMRHLVLGSPLENIRDAVRKGRMRPRVGDGVRTKVPADAIPAIKSLADQGVSYRLIAEAYGVSRSTIGDIVSGRSRTGTPHQKLSDDDVAEIRRLAARADVRQAHIAKAYGVSEATISGIISGRRRAKPTQ